MTVAVKTNFRGMRALVIHADDSNCRVLTDVLGKLGLEVTGLVPQSPAPAQGLASYDIIFADVDSLEETPAQELAQPCIAMIGTEAPSHLARVVRHGCVSHIMKPIRHSGVFAALLLAVNGHEKRWKIEQANEGLRKRMASRRLVTMAVLELMNTFRIGQDGAYERLRAGAMNRRISIEEFAREYLAGDPRVSKPEWRPKKVAVSKAENGMTNRRVMK